MESRRPYELDGSLVELIVPGREAVRLDGFWRHGLQRRRTLLLYVHGMGGDFHHSRLKKELMSRCVAAGYDFLSFNNRGARDGVATERFADCVADLDAAIRFGRGKGYRRFVLLGHSTGAQKIAWYQVRRRDPAVKAVVLIAPGDDYAIVQRNLGRSFRYWVRRAQELVRRGLGDERLPERCQRFSARRFLSIADPAQVEARLFDYGGALREFGRIRCPVLTLFGSAEEYACIPVARMGAILRAKSRAQPFDFVVIEDADHGFHGHERKTAGHILAWLCATLGG